MITERPQLFYNIMSDLWYDPNQLLAAWDNLLLAADQFSPNDLFLYDLVDVTRNSLQIVSLIYYTEIINSFDSNDTKGVQMAGQKMVDLLSDMERLLASDRHFLLGNWISDALQYASDMAESFLLQNNARNQITIWGPDGEIVDYAAKQWSGLFKSYYVPRWRFFADWLVQVIQNKTKFDGGKFNQQILQHVELPFTLSLDLYPTQPTGDSVAIVKELHTKYRQNHTGDILRKLAFIAAKAPNKHRNPFSPLSWQRRGYDHGHHNLSSDRKENVEAEKQNAEWMSFVEGSRQDPLFQERSVKKTVVIV